MGKLGTGFKDDVKLSESLGWWDISSVKSRVEAGGFSQSKEFVYVKQLNQPSYIELSL